jgi:hypothetical protein
MATRKSISCDNITAVSENAHQFESVLASAAKLQQVIPDLVLVGGTAAALHAHHRISFDHDHVLADLADRYDEVLDAAESTDGWATSVRASHPPMTLMGELDGVRGGIRQLRRSKPLEVEDYELPDGKTIRVPTIDEILRIKAFLVVDRRAVRDYLDVVALVDANGPERASGVLKAIDDYYAVRSDEEHGVLHRFIMAMSNPEPIDPQTFSQLPNYKGLRGDLHDWAMVEKHCHTIARSLAERP